MNHEQRPGRHQPGDYQPRHDEDNTLDPTTLTPHEIVRRIVSNAPDSESADRIIETFSRSGAAYAIYLTLADTDRYSQTNEADFHNVHVGSYPDREVLVDGTIESFGWNQDLDRLLQGDPMLRAVITFNREGIWQLVNDAYTVIDTTTGLHVFERDP